MIRLFLNICKTFHEIKHLNLNDFDLYQSLASDSSSNGFSCASCVAPKESLVHNGRYRRHLVFIDHDCVKDSLVEVETFRCTSCGTSHALLYSLIIPYCSYSIRFVISLVYCRLTGRFKNIPALCESFGISERTFYRIWKRLLIDSRRMNSVLDSFSGLLKTVQTLAGADGICLHSALNTFFVSCGYSFMQPLITFRQRISGSGIPPGGIR